MTASRRAAIYLRISLDATGEGLAVDRQREDCYRLAEFRGWTVIGEYVDNSISASDARKNRPGYDAMVRDYEAGKFDALLCYDLDRLTRQPRQLEDWIDAAEGKGLALVTTNGEADLTTDGGRTFARIKMAVARGEVERKSKRQKDANVQRAKLGKPPMGTRAMGYTTRGELVQAEANVVWLIFDRFLATRNMRGVARSLNDDGVPTRHGKAWHPSSVRTILRNPRYAGRVVYQGQVTGTRGTWAPIVSDDVYESVQAILDDPERVTKPAQTIERKCLGSGLYTCATCGAHVSAWSGARYRCRGGGHVTRRQAPVDEYVLNVIAGRLARPDVSDLAAPATESTAPLLEEVERIRKRLTRNDSDYDAGYIDGPRYKAARDKGEADLSAAQAALAVAQTGDALAPILDAPDPAQAFRDAPLMTQRAVIDTLASVSLSKGSNRAYGFDPETVEIKWKGTK
ncbi:recombinase family protein [Janibacter sp. G1551]|uniref:recombinase family protein n=1 Tax=Janibacter sp. G1551 TaxID=3420440 RepID=UPI003D0927F3